MLTELLTTTPWWVWMIVALGGAMVFCLAVVMPVLLVAKGAPRGSRERAFLYQCGGVAAVLAILNTVLCLADTAEAGTYSALFMLALLFLSSWAGKKQKTIREAEAKRPAGAPGRPIGPVSPR